MSASLGTIGTVLQETFAILQADAPTAYYRVVRELSGAMVDIVVDAELFHVTGRDESIVLGAGLLGGPARVTTSTEAIVDLADGCITYLEAIRSGRLSLRGDLRLMLPIARATAAFAEGAVRSPRVKVPLAALRDAVRELGVNVTVLEFTITP